MHATVVAAQVGHLREARSAAGDLAEDSMPEVRGAVVAI